MAEKEELEPLLNEIINLTADDGKIYLSTMGNSVFISIKNNIHLLYDKNTKKFVILGIKNWETYRKIRSAIDQEVREVLDKLSLSKPEFLLVDDDGKLLGLEGEIKKNVLTLLNKLTPITGKINKITINGNKVVLNNIALELESWDADIPLDEIKKVLESNIPVSIEIYKGFWSIKVHHSYSPEIASILNIEPVHIINPKKVSPLFDKTRNYYMFSTQDEYFNIVSSRNIEKYLQSLGLNISTVQQNNADSVEITDNDYKYIIIRGEGDEIHVKIMKDEKFLTSLRTYLWYFGVKSIDELKNLDKEKIVSIVNRQIKERYFYPMPFSQVKQYVMALINNTINRIDEAINDVKNKIPSFTKPIKNIASIACLFDKNCEVKLELDKIGRLSSYYSLIYTSQGHLPVPIFLEYAGIETESSCDDEGDISDTKNIIYFIGGYKEIPEEEREQYLPDDNVRGAESELFQKAVVLYNKLLPPNRRKLYYIEDDKKGCLTEYYTDDEPECPEYALPDGMGYCRDFDHQSLMQKSEDQLISDIVQSLTKIREKMVNLPVLKEESS